MNTAALLSDECARHGVDAAQFPSAEMVFADKDTRTLARHLNAIVPVSFAAVGEDRMLSCYPCLRAPLEMLLAGVTADALFPPKCSGKWMRCCGRILRSGDTDRRRLRRDTGSPVCRTMPRQSLRRGFCR